MNVCMTNTHAYNESTETNSNVKNNEYRQTLNY